MILHRPTMIVCNVVESFWNHILIIDETGNKKWLDPLEMYKEGYEYYD